MVNGANETLEVIHPELEERQLRFGSNPGLECEPILVWQRQIRLCQPKNRACEIVDLILP